MLFADAKTMVFIPDETWRTHDQIISLRGPYNFNANICAFERNFEQAQMFCHVPSHVFAVYSKILMYLPFTHVFAETRNFYLQHHIASGYYPMRALILTLKLCDVII
jgi:hypothetical protein